jgi:hypothetical protein
MKFELHITKDKSFINFPCGCKVDYETREIVKECKKHKEK